MNQNGFGFASNSRLNVKMLNARCGAMTSTLAAAALYSAQSIHLILNHELFHLLGSDVHVVSHTLTK